MLEACNPDNATRVSRSSSPLLPFFSPSTTKSFLSMSPVVIAPATFLHPELTRFVEHIYDTAASELVRRIETPLGGLTDMQIERGEAKLREIRAAIAGQRCERLAVLNGEYFSLIPHRLKIRIDQSIINQSNIMDVMIDTVKKADAEEDLLQLMRDIFHVQEDLTADVHSKYHVLGAQMSVLDSTSADYDRIERKIHVSHSWRHGFTLRVRRIFTIHLPYERARFHFDQEGESLGNVQELFHGTQTCNLVGVLSRGLLIAPRNAPCTNAMFGKGISFADQSSKSAQSCQLSSPDSNTNRGYMFLADVALGRVKRERLACYRENAPDGYDSVQGCKGAYLAHNEFVVYRASQCTLRYIVEIESC